MADKIPSIGDSPVFLVKKQQETYPLPKTRKEVLAAFERILNLGGVQKVVVELGSPIKVTRTVAAGSEVPEELQDDDLVAAARNAPMEEFIFSETLHPTNYLFRAFHFLSQRKLRARSMVANSYGSLREWLGVDKSFDISEVFGIEAKTHKEIPDGTLLIVATPIDDPDVVTFSLRLEMNLERKP